MYENWTLIRWETILSNAKHLFMESLHDHSGILEIELADYSNNIATARYKITFHSFPAYRNIDESYRLELWQRRAPLSDSDRLGWTLIVADSPWVQEFVNEPVLDLFNPGILHFLIVTENDVIEVLSNQEPTIVSLA